MAADVEEVRELVRLLGMAWNVAEVDGREKRDSEDELDAFGLCCDDPLEG